LASFIGDDETGVKAIGVAGEGGERFGEKNAETQLAGVRV
jgi:hypothetical protein